MNLFKRIYRYIKADWEREQRRKREAAYLGWYKDPKYDD